MFLGYIFWKTHALVQARTSFWTHWMWHQTWVWCSRLHESTNFTINSQVMLRNGVLACIRAPGCFSKHVLSCRWEHLFQHRICQKWGAPQAATLENIYIYIYIYIHIHTFICTHTHWSPRCSLSAYDVQCSIDMNCRLCLHGFQLNVICYCVCHVTSGAP